MTAASSVSVISSRDNPLLQRVRRLLRDPGAYRRLGCVWLEGEHLGLACLARGLRPTHALIGESAWHDQAALRELALRCARVVRVADGLLAGISSLETPTPIGFLMDLSERGAGERSGADGHAPGDASTQLVARLPTVVLDRLQDAGNVGAILRSAAALGVRQVLALKGTAALWSPKVLRAGMGAHFALHLVDALEADALAGLALPLVATSSHEGVALPHAVLPRPCAWVFGHEGQGVSAALLDQCDLKVRIPQPGGEESLNVAAAAAICLYESLRQAGS